ncbi:hypothetical protein BVRB_7g165210 [Beta vulgaris subsp. vulgaris]|nr:hypothetical protein BVRB_7g165210 [Beta vulgaris subsp. vulgaris]
MVVTRGFGVYNAVQHPLFFSFLLATIFFFFFFFTFSLLILVW